MTDIEQHDFGPDKLAAVQGIIEFHGMQCYNGVWGKVATFSVFIDPIIPEFHAVSDVLASMMPVCEVYVQDQMEWRPFAYMPAMGLLIVHKPRDCWVRLYVRRKFGLNQP